MKIALCDDDEQQLNELEMCLRAYEGAHGLNLTITRFSSGEAFLTTSEEFSIVFMDIYLDDSLGTEIIRRLDKETQVVFITTSQAHAIEAFNLGAVHYLLKPLTQAAVWEAMDRCLARKGGGTESVLQIQTSHGSIPIATTQITYIEVFNKVCVIHTTKQKFQTHTALNTLFNQLDGHQFLRPQRSFVVNMAFISAFLSAKLILKDGTEITLSRNNRAELKAQYQRFLFDLTRRGTH